jgi:S1-C subfamily serine protease
MNNRMDFPPELPEESPRPWRKRVRALARQAFPFASGMFAALLVLLLYNAFTPRPPQMTIQDINESVAQALASATPPPAFSTTVYQQILPSLVLIQADVAGEDGAQGSALGSGVVITDRGDILTSLHVVEDADSIRLTFADGSTSLAQVTASQPENDIAVLSALTPPEILIPAVLGNPNAMRVGDDAYVVGNPFGLYGSMSVGVISGFNRSFFSQQSEQRLEGLIQIDTAVNPGNSGGPLLNRSGHVVGIVVGILNPTEDDFFIGIGFAVPINIAGGAVGSPPY